MGLDGEGLEMIVTDGGKGPLAALSLVYLHVAIQRCWAHKSRNVLSYLRKVDHNAMKKDLQQIHHASSLKEAQKALGRFCERWRGQYPKAVGCLIEDEEELLSFFKIKERSFWSKIRTTNAIECRFREVRRRTRPMGVFSDRTSMERILYAVFTYENLREGTLKPFIALTQNIETTLMGPQVPPRRVQTPLECTSDDSSSFEFLFETKNLGQLTRVRSCLILRTGKPSHNVSKLPKQISARISSSSPSPRHEGRLTYPIHH